MKLGFQLSTAAY